MEWQKIVPVDERVAEPIRNVVRESFLLRNGMWGYSADEDKEANITKNNLNVKAKIFYSLSLFSRTI